MTIIGEPEGGDGGQVHLCFNENCGMWNDVYPSPYPNEIGNFYSRKSDLICSIKNLTENYKKYAKRKMKGSNVKVKFDIYILIWY